MSMIGNLLFIDAARLDMLRKNPDGIVDFLYPEDGSLPPDHFDVGKAWHVIHYLLTGTAWDGAPPLDFLVNGGEAIGLDNGNGPVRIFEPDHVQAIANGVRTTRSASLKHRLVPSVLRKADIYPHWWTGKLDPSQLEYFLDQFDAMVAFLNDGSSRRLALLVWVD